MRSEMGPVWQNPIHPEKGNNCSPKWVKSVHIYRDGAGPGMHARPGFYPRFYIIMIIVTD